MTHCTIRQYDNGFGESFDAASLNGKFKELFSMQNARLKAKLLEEKARIRLSTKHLPTARAVLGHRGARPVPRALRLARPRTAFDGSFAWVPR